MTVAIWLWVGLHRSRNRLWLHNVSASDSLAKGEGYRAFESLFECDFLAGSAYSVSPLIVNDVIYSRYIYHFPQSSDAVVLEDYWSEQRICHGTERDRCCSESRKIISLNAVLERSFLSWHGDEFFA